MMLIPRDELLYLVSLTHEKRQDVNRLNIPVSSSIISFCLEQTWQFLMSSLQTHLSDPCSRSQKLNFPSGVTLTIHDILLLIWSVVLRKTRIVCSLVSDVMKKLSKIKLSRGNIETRETCSRHFLERKDALNASEISGITCLFKSRF